MVNRKLIIAQSFLVHVFLCLHTNNFLNMNFSAHKKLTLGTFTDGAINKSVFESCGIGKSESPAEILRGIFSCLLV